MDITSASTEHAQGTKHFLNIAALFIAYFWVLLIAFTIKTIHKVFTAHALDLILTGTAPSL